MTPRPRSFDEAVALGRAKDLFWALGYEATSMQNLVDHMGIGRQSLYNTYGDKHHLYLRALELYQSENHEGAMQELATPTAGFDQVRSFLLGIAERLGRQEDRRACFLMNALMELSPRDEAVVAIGRRPVTRGLGLETLGVSINARGFIEVDERFSTSVPGIYAIGDCVPGPMLAHKAEEDGVACVELLAGEHGHVDYNTVPGVVYTDPEVASVGQTEEALKEAGTEYISGKFAFMANSRARSIGETDGAVKVLATPGGKILGAHICGAHGGDLIAELVLAMTKGATIEEVARTCHAHPAMGEAVKEACLDALGRAIHA